MHPLNLHLIAGTAALVAAVAIWGLTLNRIVRRKLRLSIFLFGIYAAAHLVFALRPAFMPRIDTDLYSFERLAFAAALINLLVVSLINPLRADRVPDRFPSIVQDAIVIGMLMLIATFAFGEKFLATSAVSAVVLGFALQDTFGNAIAGLAIQSEKPFNIGHWVRVGDFEGRVAEVSWRATRLRTKTGNFIVLPNNIVGKEAIVNYSEPVSPTRITVQVGAAYDAPPNRVKAVIQEAIAQLSSRAGRASGAGRARQVRHLVDQLRRQVLDRRLRNRRQGTRPGAQRDLLRVPPPQHRDPVPDPGGDVPGPACAGRPGAVGGTRESHLGRRPAVVAERRSTAN